MRRIIGLHPSRWLRFLVNLSLLILLVLPNRLLKAMVSSEPTAELPHLFLDDLVTEKKVRVERVDKVVQNLGYTF